MIINHVTAMELPSESEGGSETPRAEASTQGGDDEGDPFLIGATHRAKKRRRNRDPNEGVKQMLEVFEKKWEIDAAEETVSQEEEKKGRGELLGLMKENQQILKENQQTMSNAVDVLRMMADKM
jgi:hypothetical protein